jgi:6-methylsalicylate decarboxylase
VRALRGRRSPPRIRRERSGLVLELGGEPSWTIPESEDAVGDRLDELARDGTDRALISLSSVLGVETLPANEARPLLDAYHEDLTGLPDALAGWGAVKLSDPSGEDVDAALEHDAVGICLPAGALTSPDRLAACRPVLQRLEERDVPLFVHPGGGHCVHGSGDLAWWPAAVVYVCEMHAAWHAFLEWGRPAHPSLRVVFAMLAGAAPIHVERLRARGGPADRLHDPLLFYETSSYGPQALDALVRRVGAEQIVRGTDRPVIEPELISMGTAFDYAVGVANPARLLGPRGMEALA